MTTPNPSPEREGLQRWPGYDEQSWLERFTELDRRYAVAIERLAATLSPHPGRPTREEVAETLMNVVRMEHRLPPITAAQCGAGANRYFAMADAILSLFRSLGGEA